MIIYYVLLFPVVVIALAIKIDRLRTDNAKLREDLFSCIDRERELWRQNVSHMAEKACKNIAEFTIERSFNPDRNDDTFSIFFRVSRDKQ